jgi:hypothetical protein
MTQFGTGGFVAPEVRAGRHYTVTADVFCFGKTLGTLRGEMRTMEDKHLIDRRHLEWVRVCACVCAPRVDLFVVSVPHKEFMAKRRALICDLLQPSLRSLLVERFRRCRLASMRVIRSQLLLMTTTTMDLTVTVMKKIVATRGMMQEGMW